MKESRNNVYQSGSPKRKNISGIFSFLLQTQFFPIKMEVLDLTSDQGCYQLYGSQAADKKMWMVFCDAGDITISTYT